jgi:hypothetical protein
LTPKDGGRTDRYKKIAYDKPAIKRYFVEVFLSNHHGAPQRKKSLNASSTRSVGGGRAWTFSCEPTAGSAELS